MDCPKCGKEQYWVCSNKECKCHSDVPEGEKPQVHLGNDADACAYCGFGAHMDFWEERAMRQSEKCVIAPAGVTVGVE